MAGPRARLDAELVRRGLAPSRTAARAMIEGGEVLVTGLPTPKPASQVTRDQPISLDATGDRYASRGGLKLAGALADLRVDPAGVCCLDAGAAHGGFTDVLLRAGAEHVIAVDVAYGQLDWGIRTDDRVTVLERTNVRHLTPADLGGRRPALVVADLSFISLTKVLPALADVAAPAASLLPMVKPQFEAGPGRVGKGGVVRDPSVWADTLVAVVEAAAPLGFDLRGAAPSRAPGPAGNIEFFLHLVRLAGADAPGTATGPDADRDTDRDTVIDAAITAGVALRDR